MSHKLVNPQSVRFRTFTNKARGDKRCGVPGLTNRRKALRPVSLSTPSINRIKEIDRWDVDDPSLRHRFLEIGRSSEVLCHLRVLGVEDDHNLTLIAVGGVVDARIAEARSLNTSAFGGKADISDWLPDVG